MSGLTRQHFIALADALYDSRPGRYGAVVAKNCADGLAVAWSQWRDTRNTVASALRRFNSSFDRSRFDYWTEHGASESTVKRREREARKRQQEDKGPRLVGHFHLGLNPGDRQGFVPLDEE
jgi:hypothetical protein